MDELVLVDQDELAKQIENRAEEAIEKRSHETEEKRLEKAKDAHRKVVTKQTRLKRQIETAKISQRRYLRNQIDELDVEIKERLQDIRDIEGRIDGGASEETERDYLVRTGKLTAFGSTQGFVGGLETMKNHQELREPGFGPKARASEAKAGEGNDDHGDEDDEESGEDDEVIKQESVDENANDSDFELKDESDDGYDEVIINDSEVEDLEDSPSTDRNIDDGDAIIFHHRVTQWATARRNLRGAGCTTSLEEEPYLPHPTIDDAILDNTFRLPGDIHPSLFDYQKTCVQWLWELYNQKTGGILGDEMGLGKTVQVISFLAGLHHSKILTKPVLVVVPATVLAQWCNEFHRWWPPFRVVILHAIGSGLTKKKLSEEEALERMLEKEDGKIPTGEANNAGELVKSVFDSPGGVIITTYLGLGIYRRHLLGRTWGYCVLDEGHKIRNPNSIVSLTAKQIKTYNRLILSGTPIQNNLTELWSLFDFVFPGRLGTLPVFQQQFSVPINMGGYANATNVQVQTGYKCAVVLRDLINPYLLRRVKSDVARDLPKKEEKVVFVKLTPQQRELYHQFLNSEDLSSIMRGRRNVLYGVDILRKICNHPDLVHQNRNKPDYGAVSKSGKMVVLQSLLPQWQKQGHKTLLFCQTRQMLDIIEKFVHSLIRSDGSLMEYLRMDGNTSIGARQQLVDRFNTDANINIFLLTTKAGGLGVNLTGADRVIIFDPDWNPSTDIQARERAWRLGQKRDIVIYRLMTAGTIEEKIYHRQIFKTFLTNKILTDPKQKRLFKMNDLHDLFTLGDDEERGTETADIFNSSETNYGGTRERKSVKLNNDVADDVMDVAGISKMDEYQDGSAGGEQEQEFFNLGVHSTIHHDDVVNSTEERSLAEAEATKLAKQAVSALKQSSKAARQNKVGTPTWTGKFGTLRGQFGKKRPRDAPASSQSVLSSLKKQKPDDEVEVVENPTLTKIVSFLRSQPDQFAGSKSVLAAAEVKMTSKPQLLMVRGMLKEVAIWNADKKGWKLKSQFTAA